MKRPRKPRWSCFRGPLADGINAFLAAKRALGRKYETDDRSLRLLDQFLVDRGITSVGDITSEVVDAFMASRPRTEPRSYNALLGVVCRLFAWLVSRKLVSSSPVRARTRRQVQGRLAFIFDARQARRLLEAASRLPDKSDRKLRGPTYHTIFALLYGLGLRVSEAAHLSVGDLDLKRNVLTVRAAKFGKTRLVPFGPQMAATLRSFVDKRFGATAYSAQLGRSTSSPLFSFGSRGMPISTNTIRHVFQRDLIPQLGLDRPAGTTSPRVHDLRHSFAVGTLLRWYRAGIRPADRLDHLSIFLGHVRPQSTAIYLTVTADLLTQANDRFQRFAASAVDPGALP
jgi:site-specific recombinase XerD